MLATGSNSKSREEALKAWKEEEERIETRLRGIKYKLMVMSGKGGVGKSFITASLATAYALGGLKVGVLDADIHGPSIPKIFGLQGMGLRATSSGITPMSGPLGIKVISMGFLLPDEETPIIWRGPLKTRAIRQFLADVEWGALDVLLVDLPPGTGDEPLSVAQSIKGTSGAVIVTIPSSLSSLIVKKAVSFALKLGIKVLGVIENMSGFTCFSPSTVFLMPDGSLVPGTLLGRSSNFVGFVEGLRYPTVTRGIVEKLPCNELVRIKTKFGFIDVTRDHLIWIKDEGRGEALKLKRAEDVRVGDLIPLAVENKERSTRNGGWREREFMELIGYVTSGWRGRAHSNDKAHIVELRGESVSALEHYARSLRKLFSADVKLGELKGGAGYYLTVNDKDVAVTLSRYVFGEGEERALAPWLFSKSEEAIAGLIRGIFDAKGDVKGGHVTLYLPSIYLLKQIQLSLLRFKVIMKVMEVQGLGQRVGRGERPVTYCGLIVDRESIRNYARHIGFNDPHRSAKLRSVLRELSGLGEQTLEWSDESNYCWTEVVGKEVIPNPYGYVLSIRTETGNLTADGFIVHNCPKCNTTYKIFGEEGGRKVAESMGVPFLGSVPIDPRISECCDEGIPFLIKYPESPAALSLKNIAMKILNKIGSG